MQVGFRSYGSAVETVERFQRFEPDAEPGYRILGRARWGSGQHAEAIAAMRRAVQLDPYSPDAHHALGDWLVKTGNLEEGMDHLTEALALQPERDETRRLLNIARERQRSRDAEPSPDGVAD
jgi:Flp pilus assembly protein TadD